MALGAQDAAGWEGGGVICTTSQVVGILAGEIDTLVRPLYRRNGQAIAYREGAVHPIQPGRFQAHVCHVRLEAIRVSTVEALEEELRTWELPGDWPGGMLVAVIRIGKPTLECPTCIQGGLQGAARP